jgi:hypothetical protein
MWLAIAAVIVIWVFTPLIVPIVVAIAQSCLGSDLFQGAGQFGDQFGATNALFTAMTVLLVFIAFWAERNDRKEADNRWRQERADGENERKQAEERWRLERSERVAERRRDLVDSGIRHFMDAVQRYSSERASMRARGLRHLRIREPDAIVEYHGREAMVKHIARLDRSIREILPKIMSDPSDDAKRELRRIIAKWYQEFGRDVFGPVIAHVITMNWALCDVGAADPNAGLMLRSVAREALTYEDVKAIYAVAMINSEFRRFLTSVYRKDQCEVIYEQWIHDWLWSNAEDLSVPGVVKQDENGPPDISSAPAGAG